MASAIPPSVARKIGYYVYLYVDPQTGLPFYVGKGCGSRATAHVDAYGRSRRARKIREIRRAGHEPRIDIVIHGLASETAAFRVETAVIDTIGLDRLNHSVRGHGAGRIPLKDLIALYNAKPRMVKEPALLIRVNQLYRHDMPDQELYEITRGIWRLGERRRGADHVLAVHQGVVRAVYEVRSWHPAGTTPYIVRELDEDAVGSGRWEFVGGPAPSHIWRRYFGRSVASCFRRGQQNPVVYVDC